MNKLSLKWRIIIPIALIILTGIGLLAILISLRFSETTTENMKSYLEAESYRYGNAIKADMESSFSGIKALASILSNVAGTPEADRGQYLAIIREVCMGNRGFFWLWTVFEPDKWDGKDAEHIGAPYGDEVNGRFSPYVYEVDGRAGTEWLSDYEGGEYYELPRDKGREMVSSPYLDKAGGKEVYVASAAVPIIKNNTVIGVAGADLNLEMISGTLKEIKILDSGYAILLDQTGTIVHHPNEAWRTKAASEYVAAELNQAINEVYRQNRPRIVEAKARATGQDTLFVISPFTVANTGSSWLMILSVPVAEVMAPVYSGLYLIIGIGLILILAAVSILYLMVSSVTKALNKIVQGLEDSSSQASLAAGQIAASSQSLAEGATEQAASLEETSAALEEMSSMTRLNAANADKTNETMAHTSSLFNDGSRRMKGMSEAMSEINVSAEQINRIIKTIEEIAFQTNLLALNAAVEAARAGEAGAGFAVVADEVRNLAQRSAQAVNDTTALIQGTISNVETGVTVAQGLNDSFKEIQESSEIVITLIKEIAAANEQAKGVEQVNIAVSQMDQVTQQNAANAEESASAVKQLSLQASHLNNMVESLVVLISGSGNVKGPALPSGRVPLTPKLRHSSY